MAVLVTAIHEKVFQGQARPRRGEDSVRLPNINALALHQRREVADR